MPEAAAAANPLTLSGAQATSLRRLLEYVYDREAEDAAEQYLAGESLAAHVFTQIEALDAAVESRSPDPLGALIKNGVLTWADVVLREVSVRQELEEWTGEPAKESWPETERVSVPRGEDGGHGWRLGAVGESGGPSVVPFPSEWAREQFVAAVRGAMRVESGSPDVERVAALLAMALWADDEGWQIAVENLAAIDLLPETLRQAVTAGVVFGAAEERKAAADGIAVQGTRRADGAEEGCGNCAGVRQELERVMEAWGADILNRNAEKFRLEAAAAERAGSLGAGLTAAAEGAGPEPADRSR